MGALKDGMIEVVLDKPRKLLFDLNIMEALAEEYGSYDKLPEIINPENPKFLTDVKHILTMLINEAAEYQNILEGKIVEPLITEKFLGMIMNPSIISDEKTISAIYKAFNIGVSGAEPTNEDSLEDDEENPKTAATSTM